MDAVEPLGQGPVEHLNQRLETMDDVVQSPTSSILVFKIVPRLFSPPNYYFAVDLPSFLAAFYFSWRVVL